MLYTFGMKTSNAEVADLLRGVAASLTLSHANSFQIRAYENAADAVEHSTVEIFDLWQEGRLSEVPGLGEKIQGYLQELFTKGRVEHFDMVQKGIPKVTFDLLDIPA